MLRSYCRRVGILSKHLHIFHMDRERDCSLRYNILQLMHTDIIRYQESMDSHKKYSLSEMCMPYTERGIDRIFLIMN